MVWRRRRLALPSGPAAIPIPPRSREVARIHLTPFLLNGYPCLLCPCVVCFKFLQPKVIEGKKIDCALADPHLPRLLGGAPQLFTTNLVPPSYVNGCCPGSGRASRQAVRDEGGRTTRSASSLGSAVDAWCGRFFSRYPRRDMAGYGGIPGAGRYQEIHVDMMRYGAPMMCSRQRP